MPSKVQTLALLGAQWGDEGKGKITDLLAQQCDMVVRFQGGNNAGHTVYQQGQKLVLHLIPSGILNPRAVSVISHGVVVDPEALFEEIEQTRSVCDVTEKNLKVSLQCPVITTFHRLLDEAREDHSGLKIGTTKKGIGPAYEDKAARLAIRLQDLLDPESLRKKLELLTKEKKFLLEEFYRVSTPTIDEELQRLSEVGKKLAPFLAETYGLVGQALQEGKKILYEGAQGILLDLDYGSYPFVTSSSTSLAGVASGSFAPPRGPDEVLGVAKAYCTRVGEGPFPSEIRGDLGEQIQAIGKEFGATTGRKRKVGWTDLPLLRFAVQNSHLSSLALTKLDVLSGIKELKLVTGYELKDGQRVKTPYPGLDLGTVKPIYQDLTPFEDDFSGGKESFSKPLKDFLQTIEDEIEIPIGIAAYGPQREQIYWLRNYFE